MKVKINKVRLTKEIKTLQNFIDNKDFTEISSHMLFIAKKDSLGIYAGVYDKKLMCKIHGEDVEVFEEGKITCNGVKIHKILSKLKSKEDINIYNQNYDFILNQGKATFKIDSFNADQIKIYDIEEGTKIDMPIYDFQKNIKDLLPMSDTNNIKQELNGIYLDLDKHNIRMVATDTRRMGIKYVKIPNYKKIGMSFTIQKEHCKILASHKFSEDAKIIVYKEENTSGHYEFKTTDYYLYIDDKDYTFIFKNISEFEYPKYQKLFPKVKKRGEEYHAPIKIDDEFKNGLEIVSALGDMVKIDVSDKSKLVGFNTGLDEEDCSSVEISQRSSSSFHISTTIKHIIDITKSSENIDLYIKSEELPFVMKTDDMKVVCMPYIA